MASMVASKSTEESIVHSSSPSERFSPDSPSINIKSLNFVARAIRRARKFKGLFERRRALLKMRGIYSTTNHYTGLLDAIDNKEHLKVFQVFLMFKMGVFLSARDVALMIGDLNDNEEEEPYDSIEKIALICQELVENSFIMQVEDRFDNPVTCKYYVTKDLYEAGIQHFICVIDVNESINGHNLLISLNLNAVEVDDERIDETPEAYECVKRLVQDPQSSLWSRQFLANPTWLRFFFGKYSDLAQIRDKTGRFPLLSICEIYKNLEPIKFLYEIYPDAAFSQDLEGRTALILASRHGHMSIIEFLCEKCPVLVEMADYQNNIPILQAIQARHSKVAEYLHKRTPKVLNENPICLLEACQRKVTNELVLLLHKSQPEALKLLDDKGMTPFHHSVVSGNLEISKYFLNVDPNLIHLRDALGRLPIHLAAESGNFELLQFIYKSSPELAYEFDYQHRSFLSHAASSNSLSSLVFAYEKNPDAIVICDNSNRPPLFWAASHSSNWKLVSFLYDCYPGMIKRYDSNTEESPFLASLKNRRPNNFALLKKLCVLDESGVTAVDDLGRTSLSYAAEFGDLELAKYVDEQSPKSRKIPDKNNHLPMWYAVQNGDEAMVRFLHSQHPTSLTRTDASQSNQTYLSICTQKGYVQLVKFLYGRKPDLIRKRDKLGNTPLMLAIENSHFPVVRYICDVRKDCLMDVDSRGRNILAMTLEKRGMDFSLINYLYQRWPQGLESSDYEGNAAMIISEDLRLRKNVRQLIDNAIRDRDRYGRTAFFRAAIRGDLENAKSLLRKYPEALELKDYNDQTAFYVCAENGQTDVLTYLLSVNDNLIMFLDRDGKTPLYIAASEGHLETVKFLYENYPEAISIEDATERTPVAIARQRNHDPIISYFNMVMNPESPVPEKIDVNPELASSTSNLTNSV